MSNDPKDAVIDYSRLRKQNPVKYSKQLERYEQIAYEGGYRTDWLEEVGESVKVYTMICEANNNQPTFAGFMKYLGQKASSIHIG